MSYAGKETRTHRASTATGGRFPSDVAGRVLDRERPIGGRGVRRRVAPLSEHAETDWQHVAIFAAGALLGAAVGASAALLFAPQTGEEVRRDIARRGRRLRTRTADAWDDLRDELRYAARRGRRKLDRTMRRRREKSAWRDESPPDD